MLKLEEVSLLKFLCWSFRNRYKIEIQLSLVVACDENTDTTGMLYHAMGLKGPDTSKYCSNSANSNLVQF